MEINLASILAFVISVLLIPAFVYIWNQNRREVRELKAKAEKQEEEINKLEVDLEKTKTNYIKRFGQLNDNINDKFTDTNKTISNLAIEVREAITLLKIKGA